ncbi:DUF5779 family protein [Halomarina oriensis]|uniref:Cell division protein SepF n=1 Tax=Halomarina oriensis TaxID=671145 RepID=A0A6B0GM23_9EURY|nr:DUF5779 family protein [Halomarina oriensis]MWG35700.1 hypothetical protein [Halomarina oriensis]
MGNFELDLGAVEREISDDEAASGEIVLGILDGETGAAEWQRLVRNGAVLVLSVDGELRELAAGFARDVRDMGGHLVHFRGFLIVSPPGVLIDTDRLD